MNMLVTGALGFIGSNYVRRRKNAHPEDYIRVFDNEGYGSDRRNIEGLDVELFRGDIRNEGDVREAMEGIDTVVHFAAESHVDHSIKSALPFTTTNVVGTQVLLEEAVRAGVKRFHHVSTDEVYGHLPSTGYFTESSPYNPRNPYAATKAGSDHLVRACANTKGLHATISNCSNNYGPRQALDKLIPKAVEYAISGKAFPLYAGGGQVRDWLYVDDHCEAIDRIIERGASGDSFVIGGDSERTNLEIVRRVYELCGKEPLIETVTDRPGHDQRYAIDHSKITKHLGWKPTKSLEEGLEETVRWYKQRYGW